MEKHSQASKTKSDVQAIVEWLERRCDYGPPCGKCTYCQIAKTIPWFDTSGADTFSSTAIQDGRGLLEDAAKIAEDFRLDPRYSDHYVNGATMASQFIAKAIRALAASPPQLNIDDDQGDKEDAS